METTSPAHTTLMLRNVPQEYTQAEFFNELEKLGVSQWIDFLYMPPNHRQQAPDAKRKVSQLGNAGLTFINFINTDCMHDFIAIFQGGLCLRKHPVKSMNDEDLISLIP